MAFAGDRHPPLAVALGRAALAVAASGALLWFGTGLDPWWPATWFAPLPVLIVAAGLSWRGAAVTAALAWLLGMANLLHYLPGAIPLPAPAVAALYGGPTLAFTIAVLLHRALLRRGAWALAIAAFPAAWVALEYATSLASPHGTAGNLAYSQLDFVPMLQLASVTGLWGISGAVFGFAAALAVAWQLRGAHRRRALTIAGAAVAVLAVVIGLGVRRMATGLSDAAVSVGLVASDPPTSPEIARSGAATAALLDAYAERAAVLAARGARLIVLPEKLGAASDAELAAIDPRFQTIANTADAVIVVGIVHAGATAAYNEARIYTPGAPVATYHKQHLLPPFELEFAPGSELALVERGVSVGVTICKDMDFPPLSRAYGEAGIALLLVPAWDFDLDGRWHSRMAVMRGVESGFAVVRAAKRGYLTVSNSRGEIIAEAASAGAPFATLVAGAPTRHAATLYVRFGDWFAWLAVAGLVVAVAQLVRRRAAPRA